LFRVGANITPTKNMSCLDISRTRKSVDIPPKKRLAPSRTPQAEFSSHQNLTKFEYINAKTRAMEGQKSPISKSGSERKIVMSKRYSSKVSIDVKPSLNNSINLIDFASYSVTTKSKKRFPSNLYSSKSSNSRKMINYGKWHILL